VPEPVEGTRTRIPHLSQFFLLAAFRLRQAQPTAVFCGIKTHKKTSTRAKIPHLHQFFLLPSFRLRQAQLTAVFLLKPSINNAPYRVPEPVEGPPTKIPHLHQFILLAAIRLRQAQPTAVFLLKIFYQQCTTPGA
jgi:hypothetical protein